METISLEYGSKPNDILEALDGMIGEARRADFERAAFLNEAGVVATVPVRFPFSLRELSLSRECSGCFGLEDRFSYEAMKLPFKQLHPTEALPFSLYERRPLPKASSEPSWVQQALIELSGAYLYTRKHSHFLDFVQDLKVCAYRFYTEAEQLGPKGGRTTVFLEGRVYPHAALGNCCSRKTVVIEILSREPHNVIAYSTVIAASDGPEGLVTLDGVSLPHPMAEMNHLAVRSLLTDKIVSARTILAQRKDSSSPTGKAEKK